MRRILQIVAVALVAMLAWQFAATTSDAQERGAKAPAAKSKIPVSPIIVSPVPQRRIVPVLGTDNRYHVLYELELTNTLGGPADLHAVEVIDAGSGKTLLRLGVQDIIKGEYLHTLDRQTAKTISFAPFEGRVLILNLSFDSKKSVPRKVKHRFEVSGADPFDAKQTLFSYSGGAVNFTRREPPELVPPLEGKGWLASDGCCGPTGHINALVGLNGKLQGAERFAIDWIKIDADGRVVSGDKSDLNNWAGYGANVLAAGSGAVIAAKDGTPDHAPGKMPSNLSFAELPGNYLVIAMDDGVSAFYAHLKPGSLKVKVGDKVKAGQQIGAVGNNGGSLAPHLHFHIVNGRNGATSDGYPYVLKSFELAATADPSVLMKSIEGEPAFPPRSQMKPVPRKRQLPLNFNIVDFPGGR